MDTTTLSNKQRTNIWNSLNRTQQQAIMQITQTNLRGSVIGRKFNGHQQWRLTQVNIDYNWEARKPGQQTPLTCLCGHPLKYQFELHQLPEQTTKVLLGYACFADYAGIDRDVTRKLRDNVDAIQGEMDYTLYWFIKGHRFPEKKFGSAIDDGALTAHPQLLARVQLLRRAQFPMNTTDQAAVRKLVRTWRAQQKPAPLTKTKRQPRPVLAQQPTTSAKMTGQTLTATLTTLTTALHQQPELQSKRTLFRRLAGFIKTTPDLTAGEAKQLATLGQLTTRHQPFNAADVRKIDRWARDLDTRLNHPQKRRQRRQPKNAASGPNLKILRTGRHKPSGEEALRYQRYLEMTDHN